MVAIIKNSFYNNSHEADEKNYFFSLKNREGSMRCLVNRTKVHGVINALVNIITLMTASHDSTSHPFLIYLPLVPS